MLEIPDAGSARFRPPSMTVVTITTSRVHLHAALAVAFVWVVAVGSAAVGVQQMGDVDFRGVWRLNYELSDDPSPRVPGDVGQNRDDRGYRGGGGGFGGGGFGTGTGVGRVAGRGRGPYRNSRMRARRAADQLRGAVVDQLTAPRRMRITQDGAEIRLAYDDGRYVRLVPDGGAHAGISGKSQIMRTARWTNRRLVTEVELESDQTVSHELELTPAGSQLVVTTTLDLDTSGFPDAFRLVRVYDASDP